MSARIGDLHPDMIPLAEAMIAALKAQGVPHVFVSGKRFDAEQAALHAQGRYLLDYVNELRMKAHMTMIGEADNRYTVTNCDGIVKRSAHQSGEAVDIVPRVAPGESSWNYARLQAQYRAIVEEAHLLGLECGADWPPIDAKTGLGKDPPHLQI